MNSNVRFASSNPNASSFVSGMVAQGDYSLTILANPSAIYSLQIGNRSFMQRLIEKMDYESKKIEDRRDNWPGFNFETDSPKFEVKALRGWDYILNLTTTYEAIQLLSGGCQETLKSFVDKILRAADDLDRRFPLIFAENVESSPQIEILTESDTPTPTPTEEVFSEIQETSLPAKPKKSRKPKQKIVKADLVIAVPVPQEN